MRRINAPSLIELSIKTLREEIQAHAHLTPDQRYALAMTMAALRAARAEVLSEPEAGVWRLLDHIYDDGEGTIEQLAQDIRQKRVNDETHPDLIDRLEALLVSELEIRNPAALKARA